MQLEIGATTVRARAIAIIIMLFAIRQSLPSEGAQYCLMRHVGNPFRVAQSTSSVYIHTQGCFLKVPKPNVDLNARWGKFHQHPPQPNFRKGVVATLCTGCTCGFSSEGCVAVPRCPKVTLRPPVKGTRKRLGARKSCHPPVVRPFAGRGLDLTTVVADRFQNNAAPCSFASTYAIN